MNQGPWNFNQDSFEIMSNHFNMPQAQNKIIQISLKDTLFSQLKISWRESMVFILDKLLMPFVTLGNGWPLEDSQL